jgi:hypothetical protein
MNRKIVFDAVRRMLGRGFTFPEVRILDQVLEAMRPGPDIRILSHGVSLAGIRLIKAYEGCVIKAYEGCARLMADGRNEAYPDSGTGGAPWTIDWGQRALMSGQASSGRRSSAIDGSKRTSPAMQPTSNAF